VCVCVCVCVRMCVFDCVYLIVCMVGCLPCGSIISIETGGDNVTRIHASFRKVSSWLDKNTDFNDLGRATSRYLVEHPNALCITWKMVAFPGPVIVSQVLESHLSGQVQVPPCPLLLCCIPHRNAFPKRVWVLGRLVTPTLPSSLLPSPPPFLHLCANLSLTD
jgi:hypothetical protein